MMGDEMDTSVYGINVPKLGLINSTFYEVSTMDNSTVIGIDLAKSVFQGGVMTDGKLTSNKQVKRARLHSVIANSPPSTIAKELMGCPNYPRCRFIWK